ncbi:hypothetical protein [Martelella mediterranea]|uniref:Uncharacterized protein n=1 Tax=Martelella mediterranea DSM 17316 TaxID=1122214 RepID=A0A1U9Z2L1_9HYPH|nr:hypothetical protein [Martelella mediterranea]AQZ51935.1 hypothetical protein Mame_02609 [Martelella mediterranea DSM 17316]
MNLQASDYLGGVRDEMRLFIRARKRPTVNELEGILTRLNTGIALTEELEAEHRLLAETKRHLPPLKLTLTEDTNGGDAA